MSWRCFLGIHRWEFTTSIEHTFRGEFEVTYARCRRRCHRYRNWVFTNRDRLR